MASSAQDQLLSQHDFQAMLDCEAARSDRSGRAFSVVCMPLGSHCRRSRENWLSFTRRLRCYDAVGWVGPGVLGVLLPDTAQEGAQAVTGIAAAMGLPAAAGPAAVYEYPGTRQSCGQACADVARRGGDTGSPEMPLPTGTPLTPLWERVRGIASLTLAALILLLFSI